MSGVFDAYATYYDLMYRDKDYGAEAAYLDALIREFLPGPCAVLELGSGTGAHAAALARLGHRVSGCDLSESMLARARALRAALPAELAGRLRFEHGDIRDWRSGERHDVALSLFHVISYLPENADVTAALANAASQLETGGLLLFDFWYGPAVLSQRPQTRVRELEDERIRLIRVAEPELDTGRNRVDVHYRLLVEERASGRLQRLSETHRMRYFFQPELEHFLALAGFEVLRFEEWLTGAPLSADTWGALVAARKLA